MTDLRERLRLRIAAQGPIRFRDWMQACLYGPDGYYMVGGSKTGTGHESDFATAPTLHPFFAQAVAQEIRDAWTRCGSPTRFVIVEFGGGEGDLAKDALKWFDANEPKLGEAARWIHIETSPMHRAKQAGDWRLAWAKEMPAIQTGFVVANEFLDALPFDWLEWDGSGWQEIAVGFSEGKFHESKRKPDSDVLASAPAGKFEVGQRVVAMTYGHAWLQSVALKLGKGSVLLADYGDRGDRLWTDERAAGTVRTFRSQEFGGDPLEDPGLQDITASVDFTLTKGWGEGAGMKETAFETQERFLLRHGILEALNAIDRTTREGASSYLRLRQLMLPTGLGTAFKVQRFEK